VSIFLAYNNARKLSGNIRCDNNTVVYCLSQHQAMVDYLKSSPSHRTGSIAVGLWTCILEVSGSVPVRVTVLFELEFFIVNHIVLNLIVIL
jgi:hypothetical protein